MAARVVLNQLIVACFCVAFNFFFSYSSVPSRLPIGIHPLDEKYYDAELIKCKDGSKSFSRNRLNDDFCDCPDGTDEPGTSACPSGKFYCRNMGSTPIFLFSSRVNDQICDCCDGSDENDGNAICPNTCVRGGNIVYQRTNHDSVVANSRKTKHEIVDTTTHKTVDATHKPSGLKTLVFLQMALVLLLVAFLLYPRRKTRRRTSSMSW